MFEATKNIDGGIQPRDLIETPFSHAGFIGAFGLPWPGSCSATFGYKVPEWAWRRSGTQEIVKAAFCHGKVVLAISSPGSYCAFLTYADDCFEKSGIEQGV